MSLSLPVHPGERNSRRGAAWPSARTGATPGDSLQRTADPCSRGGHWPLLGQRVPRQTSMQWRKRMIKYKSFRFTFPPLWCYGHKKGHFFCLNCFSMWAALHGVGWLRKISVNHQGYKLCAAEDASSRKDKWRCVGRRNGGLWTPCTHLCMWCVYLMHKGGQSSAVSFNPLPSEEWDRTSSRLLVAVFVNIANFIIIQKV